MARIHSIRRVANAARSRAQAIKSIMQALQRTQRSKSKAKLPFARRAVNAMHTRSQGDRADPPVRLQTPRLRIEPPQYGIHEARFHCGGCTEILPDGTRVNLAASSLQESTLDGAGRGVIVRQFVPPNTMYLEYGGVVVGENDAKRMHAEVICFVVCVSFHAKSCVDLL